MQNQKINLSRDTGSHTSVTLDIGYRLRSPGGSEEERVLGLSWRKKKNICHAICHVHPYGLDIVWSVIPWKKPLVAHSSCLSVYSFPFHTCHLHLENVLTVQFVDINIVSEYYSSSTPFRTPTQEQIWQTCQSIFTPFQYTTRDLKVSERTPHGI